MLLKHKYLFICFLLLTFTAFNIPAHAQAAARLDSLNNKFALQFQISDNFNLSSFQGTTFSGKYNVGCRSSVRLGLSINMNDLTSKLTINPVDTSIILGGYSEQNVLGFNIRAQYIHYFPSEHNTAFYAGGGPFVGFTKGTEESRETGYITQTKKAFETEIISTGIDFLIGTEWMFSEYMSLSAEYGIRFTYQSAESTRTEIFGETISKNTIYRISGGDVNFGLTVYF